MIQAGTGALTQVCISEGRVTALTLCLKVGFMPTGEVWYWGMGKPGEAEPLCRRALDIYEHKCGRSSPYVATALQALSEVLKELSRWVWLFSVQLCNQLCFWAAGLELAKGHALGSGPLDAV